ncbi:tripartite tricarboxylate transporter substrate-binding protein, partial [Acinetobacter baumannii]
HMRTDAGYDPVKDFLPVTQMVRIQWVLVAHPSLGLKSAEAFVSKALSSPNTLTFASGGVGSPQHVAMEILMHASGAKLRHVPYRGVTQ